jgi:ABC-2 type transport system ATP-binding protein
MAAEGVTIFVTTHYLDEAEYCHRLALIHAGRLVALGTVAELKEVFSGRAVIEIAAPRPAEALEALAGQPFVLETSIFGARLHLVVDDVEESGRKALDILGRHGNVPATVERIAPSLEDVFIHHVEAEEARMAAGGARA